MFLWQLDIHQPAIDMQHAAGWNNLNGKLVDAGDFCNDAAHGRDGFTFRIQDSQWCMPIMLEAVQRIGANCRALAGGEYQHLTGDALPLQLMPMLNDNP